MSEIRSLQYQEEQAWANYTAAVLDGGSKEELAAFLEEWKTAKINLQNGTFDYVQSIL